MTGTAFAFWKFSGSTGRAAFLMNSLILGALFGAVFTFIVPLEGVRFYALVLGAAIGALSVVLTGLQAMYGGLFYVALLMFGSWNSRGIVVVVVLLYLLAAAYA